MIDTQAASSGYNVDYGELQHLEYGFQLIWEALTHKFVVDENYKPSETSSNKFICIFNNYYVCKIFDKFTNLF